MTVPNIFANVTTSIPLSQLDTNFATAITLGNTAVYLGNTTTTLGNLTLTNVTLSSGTNNIGSTSISNGTSNVSIASSGGNITMASNGTTAITVDTSQNVGIGTASPTDKLTVPASVRFGATSSNRILYLGQSSPADNGAGSLEFQVSNTVKNWAIRTNNNVAGALEFCPSTAAGGTTYTSPSMLIDSSGNVLVGTTNSNSNSFKLKVQAGSDVCVGLASATIISGALTFNFINDANSANVPVDFRCNGFYISNGLATGAGTNAVKFNTSTKQLTYDTSSARYKNNIRDSIYGLDHVMQMRSAQFEYKDTGNSDVGLIAEEMQPIIPELVGLNEEGLADSVSYDRMVSVLVKAIQELKAINDSLTARIVALEVK